MLEDPPLGVGRGGPGPRSPVPGRLWPPDRDGLGPPPASLPDGPGDGLPSRGPGVPPLAGLGRHFVSVPRWVPVLFARAASITHHWPIGYLAPRALLGDPAARAPRPLAGTEARGPRLDRGGPSERHREPAIPFDPLPSTSTFRIYPGSGTRSAPAQLPPCRPELLTRVQDPLPLVPGTVRSSVPAPSRGRRFIHFWARWS
jgi:hypothetical protein